MKNLEFIKSLLTEYVNKFQSGGAVQKIRPWKTNSTDQADLLYHSGPLGADRTGATSKYDEISLKRGHGTFDRINRTIHNNEASSDTIYSYSPRWQGKKTDQPVRWIQKGQDNYRKTANFFNDLNQFNPNNGKAMSRANVSPSKYDLYGREAEYNPQFNIQSIIGKYIQ